jgi:hypothetical protein
MSILCLNLECLDERHQVFVKELRSDEALCWIVGNGRNRSRLEDSGDRVAQAQHLLHQLIHAELNGDDKYISD